MSEGVNPGDVGTATSTAAAATINHAQGVVTTEALTTAAAAEYTFTLTNSIIDANAVVMVSIASGTNTTAGAVVSEVKPGAGTCTIIIKNTHATVALNGTMKIAFSVLA